MEWMTVNEASELWNITGRRMQIPAESIVSVDIEER